MRHACWFLPVLVGCATDPFPAGDGGIRSAAGTDAGRADGGTGDAGPRDCGPAPTFSALHDGILSTQRCANRFCHAPGVETGGLNLGGGKAAAYRELVREATTATVAFPRRVVPGDAAASYLFIKVSSSDPGGAEGRMPPGQPLGACQVHGIRLWIEAGASND